MKLIWDFDRWLISTIFQPLGNFLQFPHEIGRNIAPGLVPTSTIYLIYLPDIPKYIIILTILCNLSIAYLLWKSYDNTIKRPNLNYIKLFLSRICAISALFSCAFFMIIYGIELFRVIGFIGYLIWILSAYLLSIETPLPKAKRKSNLSYQGA